MLASAENAKIKLSAALGGGQMFLRGTPPPKERMKRSQSTEEMESKLVEIELLIPGLCTLEVKIPIECTIPDVKKILIERANRDLLSYSDATAKVDKAWVGSGHVWICKY
jgi:hypothetical protein